MYVEVLTQISAKAVDQYYVYSVPEVFRNNIKIGIRVRIPFGKMELEGFVMNILNDTDYDKSKIRDISDVVDDRPVLNKEMILLGKYMSKHLLCSLVSAYQVMLPKALKAKVNTNIKIKYNKYLEEDKRYSYTGISNYKRVVLNEEQEKAKDIVVNSFGDANTYLLYGVTGSGKTEVYMSIIEEALKLGKEAIMLVPEISLTPQVVGKFISRFGDVVAVLHSKLSDTERYDEYRKITTGEAKIVIGTRSAIFVPFNNIGVIIIDEEHTSSYKQENHPRYNAKDIAILRSKYHKCPVVMGSATPSLESFARAGNKVYKLLVLSKRPSSSTMPNVEIIDMKEEVKKGNFILSDTLKCKIKEKLDRKEQSIILLNRRGYSSIISCRECGYTEKCPKCDVTYTYHKTSNNLKCHYCGTAKVPSKVCPKCGSKLRDFGLGTEKLEEELNKLFKARIVRMDVDTTSKKGEHQKIIDDFGEHKYDILIGTQMIAKGLDFPLVTLVGVVSVDSSLMAPDFRASENTFQLLSQVAGRAGRSTSKGEVIIQTYNPDHYSIMLAKNHDYLKFYKEEMSIRKMLKYPPYYYLALVSISSRDYEGGFKEANKIGNYLRSKLGNSIILGPTTSSAFKINNIYHYQIIIKYQREDNLISTLNFIIDMYKNNNKIDVEVDFNPIRI